MRETHALGVPRPQALSDDELDELERDNASHWRVTEYDTGLLIAQSREANRLRELCDGEPDETTISRVIEEVREPYSLRLGWRSPGMVMRHFAEQEYKRGRAAARKELARDEDPAARAKRELGEWLVKRPGRTWERLEDTVSGVFRVFLSEHGRNAGEACAREEHEAITAALRAAKEAGR